MTTPPQGVLLRDVARQTIVKTRLGELIDLVGLGDSQKLSKDSIRCAPSRRIAVKTSPQGPGSGNTIVALFRFNHGGVLLGPCRADWGLR